MNASTVSRQIGSFVPALKSSYKVISKDGKVLVLVQDFKIQLILENAANNFGYMCVENTMGFEVA